MNEPFTHLTVTCSCSRLDHCVRFSHDAEDDLLYVEVAFPNGYTFWERVKKAWRYVFGNVCPFGFAEVIVPKEDRGKLREWLDAAKEKP